MKKISLLFAFVLLMASCSENNLITPDPDSGEGVHTTLALSVAPMQGDKGDSVKSRSFTGVDESLVNSLWVLQFETQSKKLLKKSYLPITNLAKVDIVLAENAASTTSNIYFVANVSKLGLVDFYGDETAFQSASEAVTSELGIVTANGDYAVKVIPMCSNITGKTVGKYGITGGISTELVRMLARLDFTTTVGSSALTKFTPKNIRIGNVPSSMPYVSDVKCTAGVFSTPLELVQGTASNNYSATYTFYVPGNLCGNNPAGSVDRYKTGVPDGKATYVEISGPGVDVYLGEDIYFRIFPGSNTTTNYDIMRNTRYAVTANLSNVLFSDRRTQRSGSNCYIVKPGGSINIPIFRANLSALGDQIPDVSNSGCTARVFWEAGPKITSNNPITTGDIITVSNATCTGGFFTVKATDSSGGGNAVVAITKTSDPISATNPILWSWHIWVTDADFIPTTNTNTLTTTNNGVSYTWMDRNLGALAVAATGNYFDKTAGMLYQWGRKDPFLPAIVDQASITSTTGTMPIAGTGNIGASYYSTYNGLLSFVNSGDNYLKRTTAALGTTGYIKYGNQLATSIASPMLFIQGWSGSVATGAVSATVGKDSWNGDTKDLPKSIYDPCPTGWRVPSGFKNNNTSTYVSPWAGMVSGAAGITSPNPAETKALFVTQSAGSYGDWSITPGSVVKYGKYPASGCRNADGTFDVVGSYGCYWSGSVNSSSGYFLTFFGTDVTPGSGYDRPSGFPVRCVQE